MNTITIGGEQIPRTVVGAIGRLELATEAFYPKARADVDFLRDEFNRVEAERDELVALLRSIDRQVGPMLRSGGYFHVGAMMKCRSLLGKIDSARNEEAR